MNREPCEAARRLWSEAFDGGQAVPEDVKAHLAACGLCQEFQAGAVLIRERLASVPLPLPSPDRDRQLLAQLQLAPQPTGSGRANWVSRWLQRFQSPAVPMLAAVGFAAFALTLVTAHLLTVLPAERPLGPPPGAASARNAGKAPAADLVERWLASPQPRLIPIDPSTRERPLGPRATPERGSGDATDRRRSGDADPRAHTTLG